MATIAASRVLRKDQYYLDPFIPKAREIEAIREAAKLSWRADETTDKRTHFWGALGELVVAEALGTEVDETAHPDSSDHGVDGTFCGLTYDIKTSSYFSDPVLKVPVTTKEYADIFILVAINQDALIAEIVGWATESEVRRATTRSFGRGTNFCLTRRELHPFAEIWDITNV
jgi:hypothetical protein